MVFKRKLFKKKQILLKLNYVRKELKLLINKSLFRNHYNNYMFRLSFTINIYLHSKKDYFLSLQKMFCPYTLSKKVPSRHFLFSRFYLNKKLNYLKISNTYK
jgi:hypothetical protein